MTSARRRVGWLVAASLLLYGWLPVGLQASVMAGMAEGRHSPDAPICSAAVASAATAPQPTRRPGCPAIHDPICLCAIFASLLAAGPGPTPAPPEAVGGARYRLPTRRPGRSRPVPPFEARDPARLRLIRPIHLRRGAGRDGCVSTIQLETSDVSQTHRRRAWRRPSACPAAGGGARHA